MFTDIVGYTAMMGSDEDAAFEILRKNREIHNRIVPQYNGTLVKEIGDGMLISFHLSSEAVRCAIEIQHTCKIEDIPLKIGVHEGEVVSEGMDVLGDNVNIASRLLDHTGKGNINISESVYKNIRNKADIRSIFLEEKVFKNVDEPVRVYRVLTGGEELSIPKPSGSKKRKMILPLTAVSLILLLLSIWKFWPDSPLADTKELSIAVLPFVNLSNDPEQEYFSDGMTEELIVHLAKVGDLQVTSRTSVYKYKNQSTDLKTIAADLNVSYILEGSVRKEDENVRINVQLIDATTDRNIWSEIFNRKANEILNIQSEVAREVANALGISLSIPELERIQRKSTNQFSAYEYYLKAVHEDKKWSVKGALEARDLLTKALQLDPEFSEAYSLYAWQYINLAAGTHVEIDPYVALNEAVPAIKKAIELDPLSSDAWLVDGAINFYLKWDFEQAKRSYERSMELNSWGEAPIYQCICAYSEFLITTGDFTTLNNLFDNVNRIDPAFFQNFDYQSLVQILHDEPELAIKTFEKRIPYSEPDDWQFFSSYGVILYMAGKYDKAIENLSKAIELKEERDWYTLTFLAISYLHAGIEDRAYEILEELIHHDEEGRFGLNTYIALIYHDMGDEEKVFDYLLRAYKAHEPILIWILPIHFRNLNGNARYKTLMMDIGFDA